MVAASAAAPAEHPGRRRGCGPCGAPGATGGLPGGGRELAGGVRGRVADIATDGARQQCGGVYERGAADAPVAAQDGDAGLAGPEAPVLELSRIPWGEAAWPLPLRALGAETGQLSVLGPALDANPGSRGGLIPSSVKLQSYALGRSPGLLPRTGVCPGRERRCE